MKNYPHCLIAPLHGEIGYTEFIFVKKRGTVMLKYLTTEGECLFTGKHFVQFFCFILWLEGALLSGYRGALGNQGFPFRFW